MASIATISTVAINMLFDWLYWTVDVPDHIMTDLLDHVQHTTSKPDSKLDNHLRTTIIDWGIRSGLLTTDS